MKLFSILTRTLSTQSKAVKKPLMLLDIDGVLARYSYDVRKSKKVSFDGDDDNDVWMNTRKSLIPTINRWHEENLVEIKWLTSWEERAQTEFAPKVGIKHNFELGFVHDEKYDCGFDAKRLSALKQANFDPKRPLIWIDDDMEMNFNWNNSGEIAERITPLLQRPCTLIIRPNQTVGLSKEHEALIDDFLRNDPNDGVKYPTCIYVK